MVNMDALFNDAPSFVIAINDASAPYLNNHVISIRLEEHRGFEADTLNIVIDDAAGRIALPHREAEITLAIGFGADLVEKGKFIVDSIAHSGPPDIITIGAHSADFKKDFIERKSKLYEAHTIGEIVEKIAGEHGFQYSVADRYRDIPLKAKQQADESDANFLTRLAEEFDAIATIKMGKLLFLERGIGKTASGQSMPTVTHRRSDGDQHSYSVNDRNHYTGVEVRYMPPNSSTRKSLIIGEEERLFRVRKLYNDEREAEIAGEMKLKQLARDAASATLNIARGNPRISPESPLILQGFKKEMDAQKWIVTGVSHEINSQSGFTSELAAEVLPE